MHRVGDLLSLYIKFNCFRATICDFTANVTCESSSESVVFFVASRKTLITIQNSLETVLGWL